MGDEVMERYRNPAYRGELDTFAQHASSDAMVVRAKGDNPLCGDVIEVALILGTSTDGSVVVERACWNGYGCSLCIAAVEALLEAVQGRPVSEALAVDVPEVLGLLGDPVVSRSRMGCVALPMEVLAGALGLSR